MGWIRDDLTPLLRKLVWSENRAVHGCRRDGTGMGLGQRMRSLSLLQPCKILFCPIPNPTLVLHDRKNFLTPSLPFGALWSSTPPHKTLLLVNLLHNYYNFFNKNCFINKNTLEITTKFIPSNRLIFSNN